LRVLRVFRLQTLEINLVVKYSTYLDPRLVPRVQYSSHTILQWVLVLSISREGDKVQLQGVSSRAVHHLEEIHSIWVKEKEFGQRDFWVFFVGPRASYLSCCGGEFSVILFTGNWHELERGRAHYKLRIQPY
jgi:hypothetical protein